MKNEESGQAGAHISPRLLRRARHEYFTTDLGIRREGIRPAVWFMFDAPKREMKRPDTRAAYRGGKGRVQVGATFSPQSASVGLPEAAPVYGLKWLDSSHQH